MVLYSVKHLSSGEKQSIAKFGAMIEFIAYGTNHRIYERGLRWSFSPKKCGPSVEVPRGLRRPAEGVLGHY